MPDFDGFPVDVQAAEVRFEGALYNLLQSEPDIRASRLLYFRAPVQQAASKPSTVPLDLRGRRLFVFEKSEGANNVWKDLNSNNKVWCGAHHNKAAGSVSFDANKSQC